MTVSCLFSTLKALKATKKFDVKWRVCLHLFIERLEESQMGDVHLTLLWPPLRVRLKFDIIDLVEGCELVFVDFWGKDWLLFGDVHVMNFPIVEGGDSPKFLLIL